MAQALAGTPRPQWGWRGQQSTWMRAAGHAHLAPGGASTPRPRIYHQAVLNQQLTCTCPRFRGRGTCDHTTYLEPRLIRRGLLPPRPVPPKAAAPSAGGNRGKARAQFQQRPSPTNLPSPYLRALVSLAVADKVGRREAFTAYDITQTLRTTHPGEDIPHLHGVREAVHSQMAPLLAQRRYRRVTAMYAGTEAQCYEPAA